MNFADSTYLWLALVLIGPASVLLLADFLLRKRGGVLRGWKGAVFIATCWMAGFALIIHRVAS